MVVALSNKYLDRLRPIYRVKGAVDEADRMAVVGQPDCDEAALEDAIAMAERRIIREAEAIQERRDRDAAPLFSQEPQE